VYQTLYRLLKNYLDLQDDEVCINFHKFMANNHKQQALQILSNLTDVGYAKNK